MILCSLAAWTIASSVSPHTPAGTILNVKVAAGDQVKKGQVVAILEAMKLENEIVANADGVVKQVLVSKGQTVNNQQTLLIIG